MAIFNLAIRAATSYGAMIVACSSTGWNRQRRHFTGKFRQLGGETWPASGTRCRIGDFNGDGPHDDILWRHDNGVLTNWLGDADGGFTVNNDDALTQVGLDWFVAGTGDYNADGRDILWRKR